MPIEINTYGITHDRATAIVVAAGSDAAFLPQTVAALAAQSIQPHQIVLAVPTAATAHSALRGAEIPAEAMQRITVVPVGRTANFGTAIKVALERLSRESCELAGNAAVIAPERSWLWLLHADAAPEPGALAALLNKAESSAKIGIVGPKHVASLPQADTQSESGAVPTRSQNPPVLREMGIRATRTARRVPEMRDQERDQGQYDAREDVLAVGSAGMLVRRAAWDQLGGFNPHLGPYGDGLEFSRRMRLAGYRVVLAPDAVVAHSEHSLREASNLARTFGARRRAQIFNALLAAPRSLMLLMWLGYILAAIPRALVRLVWRDPVRARGELAAGAYALGMLGSVTAGRTAISRLPGRQSDLRSLEASGREVREAKKALRLAETEEAVTAPIIDPLEERAQRDLKMHTLRGAGVTLLLSAIFGALIHVPYMASGTLTGGGLGVDGSTASELWAAGWHSWLASGDGYAGTIDPYWLFFIPILLLGSPWGLTLGGAVTASLYAAAPIAAIFAYLAAGRFTKSSVVRTGTALLWVLSPSFLEALASGRSAAVCVHVLLPLILFAVVGAWRGRPYLIGLASLTVVLAGVASPMVALGALVIALIGFIARPKARAAWLWIPLPALLFLVPTMLSLPASWRAWLAFLFAQPGKPSLGITDPSRIVTGFTSQDFELVNPGWNWLLYLPLLLVLAAAVLALARLRVAGTVRTAWGLIVAGMAIAIASAYVPVATAPVAGQIAPVAAWHGIGFSIAWLGVVTAIAAAANGLRAGLRKRARKPIMLVAGALGALMPLAMLSIASYWTFLTWTDSQPVLRGAPTALVPAIGATNQASAARSRVLAIDATAHGYQVEIWRGSGLTMHEYTIARGAKDATAIYPISRSGVTPQRKAAQHYDLASADLASALADVAGASPQVPQMLGEHAISVVVLPPAGPDTDSQARQELQALLNGVPGLEYVTENETGVFWRVPAKAAGGKGSVSAQAAKADAQSGTAAAEADAPARLRIVNGSDGSWLRVPAGVYGARWDILAASRTGSGPQYLVLAERASASWRATLGGEKLAALSPSEAEQAGIPSWAQAWVLPEGANGTLVVRHDDLAYIAMVLIQMLSLLAAIVATMPLRSRKEDVA